MTRVFVGLGSNVAPHAHITLALDLLDRSFAALDVSPIYRCAPVGFCGPDFLNLVAGFETASTLHGVVEQLRDIEAACGRDRAAERPSRTMDIDLLLFGDLVREADPPLPRRDIDLYPFVLRPLAELAPTAVHPLHKRSFAALWADFAGHDHALERVTLDADAPITM